MGSNYGEYGEPGIEFDAHFGKPKLDLIHLFVETKTRISRCGWAARQGIRITSRVNKYTKLAQKESKSSPAIS